MLKPRRKKKNACFVLSFLCYTFLAIFVPHPSFLGGKKLQAADVDPRLMVVGSLALYGTAGGALLGAASLAYNAKPRAIAMGASIGLYVGLLFGGYIVLSHHYLQSSQNIKGAPGSGGSSGDRDDSSDEEDSSEFPTPAGQEDGREGKDLGRARGVDYQFRQELFAMADTPSYSSSKVLFFLPIVNIPF